MEILPKPTFRGQVTGNNQGAHAVYFLRHKGTIAFAELLPSKSRLYRVLPAQPFKLPSELENRRCKGQNTALSAQWKQYWGIRCGLQLHSFQLGFLVFAVWSVLKYWDLQILDFLCMKGRITERGEKYREKIEIKRESFYVLILVPNSWRNEESRTISISYVVHWTQIFELLSAASLGALTRNWVRSGTAGLQRVLIWMLVLQVVD